MAHDIVGEGLHMSMLIVHLGACMFVSHVFVR